MSKPRWIDTGVFRTLRTATRKRSLAVIAGPAHGTAEASNRAQLKALLGDGDRASVQTDARFHSAPDEALRWLHRLRQPGLITTSVSDALAVSLPEDAEAAHLRLYGPAGKGLNSAWDRKDPFVMHLVGRAADPASLVLTAKDRKAILGPDGRYQSFLRATFSRTVLFTGFQLDDPDLNELLEDVARGFNGHVPANIALVPAGAADPATALRANVHYGMTIVEFPPELSPSAALQEVAQLLEELEVPKPATGNPPGGFTDLSESMRGQVPAPTGATLARYDAGDSSSWSITKEQVDAPRAGAAGVEAFLLDEPLVDKVRVALVRGRSGDGKTTLLRRLAWSLASRGAPVRVFWRESGAGLPDTYVPAEADAARAIFVADDAEDLVQLPNLLKNLAAAGHGKARFLLGADDDRWERLGMDHRLRLHTELHEVRLSTLGSEEAEALAKGLQSRGRLAPGSTVASAAAALTSSEGPLLDRLGAISGGGDIRRQVEAEAARLGARPDAEVLRRAWLAIALVHRHGMSLARAHLSSLVAVPEAELESRVLGPLGSVLVSEDTGALRTPHPLVAATVVARLAPEEATIDAMVLDLLRAMPGGAVADHTVLHSPSELIRARRQFPLPPLTLGQFFEAGESSARNDVHFWFDRGRYESDFSRWEPAIAAFDHALWQRPGDGFEREHNAVVQANRSRCLSALGRKKEALRAVEEGLRHSPQDSTLLRLHEKLGGRRRPAERGERGERGEHGERGDRRDGGGGRGRPRGGSRSGGGPGGGGRTGGGHGGGGRGAGGPAGAGGPGGGHGARSPQTRRGPQAPGRA